MFFFVFINPSFYLIFIILNFFILSFSLNFSVVFFIIFSMKSNTSTLHFSSLLVISSILTLSFFVFSSAASFKTSISFPNTLEGLQLKLAKSFFFKFNFDCDGCQEEYIGQTGSLSKEGVSFYKQHIEYPQYSILKVEQHI